MATLSWLLDVNAPNAAKTFDQIAVRMDKLDANLKKTREISVGDRSAMATFAKLQAQADRFKDKLHGMDLTIDGAGRAEAQLLGLEATADRLSKKLGGKGLGGGGFFRGLLGLLPGVGGTAGAAAQGGSSAFGSLGAFGQGGQALQGAGIGTAAVLAGLLTPALLPLALGGGVGLGGGLLAGTLGTSGLSKLRADRQALARARLAVQAPGPASASQMLTLHQAQSQFAKDQARYGAFVPFGRQVSRLGDTALGALTGALTARGPAAIGPGGRPIAGSGAPSFLMGLTGILKQIGGFIKSIGPQLADLFRASLPFLQLFVKALEQAAKTLLPVFVHMLEEMTPELPIIAKGLSNIVDGLAGFLKAIGPAGMQASAKIFVFLTKIMAGALVGLGHTINWLTEHVPTWVHNVAAWWDRLRGWTARTFDTIRHDIMSFFHGVASDFDTWRHGWAHIWDTVYSNTIGVVIRLDRGIVNWLSKIQGQVNSIFRGAGHWLYQAGKDVVQGLWNGLLFVWHKVTSFISGIASWIKAHKGPVHLDAKLLEPAGRALMGGLLKGLVGGFGGISSFIGGVAGRIARGLGISGGGATAAQGIALKLLPSFGWGASQFGPLNALWMGESGWRWNALNQSSGAYGIPQALPASKMASAGADWRTNPATQILWGLSYIKSIYGTPANAYAQWLARSPHWYGRGLAGGVFDRPTLIGVGERGPERVDVTPLGRPGRGGALVQFGDVNIYDATDVALVQQKLSFAMTAAGLG